MKIYDHKILYHSQITYKDPHNNSTLRDTVVGVGYKHMHINEKGFKLYKENGGTLLIRNFKKSNINTQNGYIDSTELFHNLRKSEIVSTLWAANKAWFK